MLSSCVGAGVKPPVDPKRLGRRAQGTTNARRQEGRRQSIDNAYATLAAFWFEYWNHRDAPEVAAAADGTTPQLSTEQLVEFALALLQHLADNGGNDCYVCGVEEKSKDHWEAIFHGGARAVATLRGDITALRSAKAFEFFAEMAPHLESPNPFSSDWGKPHIDAWLTGLISKRTKGSSAPKKARPMSAEEKGKLLAVATQPSQSLFICQCVVDFQAITGFRGQFEGITLPGMWVETAPGARVPFASNDPGQLLALIDAGASVYATPATWKSRDPYDVSLRDVSLWIKSWLPSLQKHRELVLGPLVSVPEASASYGLFIYKARYGNDVSRYDSRAHETWFSILCGLAKVKGLTPSSARTGGLFEVVEEAGIIAGQQHMQHMHIGTTISYLEGDVCSSLGRQRKKAIDLAVEDGAVTEGTSGAFYFRLSFARVEEHCPTIHGYCTAQRKFLMEQAEEEAEDVGAHITAARARQVLQEVMDEQGGEMEQQEVIDKVLERLQPPAPTSSNRVQVADALVVAGESLECFAHRPAHMGKP